MTDPGAASHMHRPTATGPQQLIATFPDYLGAQRLVDRMSDDGFPVEHVRIIGDGVRMVEQVTGRMTRGKAALAGVASGAWFGLLIGLLLGLFAIGPAWLWLLLVGLVIGAVWGAMFGFLAHWATRGQRDFASVTALQAERYEVYVDASHAAQAAPYQL
jgi:MFS family permease